MIWQLRFVSFVDLWRSHSECLLRFLGSNGRARLGRPFDLRHLSARDLPDQLAMISIGGWVYIRTLAIGAVFIAEVIPHAADSLARCYPASEAAQYDREADEYDEVAERY